MSASALFRRAAVAPRMASAARAFSTTPSNNVARITIVGNLADAPEVVPTSTGREIVRYAVASNSGPKDNRQTSWFRVTSFEAEGPRRDFLQSLPKGYACTHIHTAVISLEGGREREREDDGYSRIFRVC